jgi:hypothetical protein
MSGTGSETLHLDGTSFDAKTDYKYTKPKANASGGKSIGVLNAKSNKGLYLSTPLMLTWGVNEYTDEKSGRKTYDMTLQFPKEEYNSENQEKFLANMKSFESKLKADAIDNSKEWMNKQKLSAEVLDALWTPMLKYPKNQESGEFDYTRPPTLRLKLPLWEGDWKVELYDMEQKALFPNDNGLFPPDLIGKATNVATIIQCGGIWIANGKLGVTWKLVQAVVQPKQSMRGKCFINLSVNDKAQLAKAAADSEADADADVSNTVNVVESSSDEDESSVPTTSLAMEVQKEIVATAPLVPVPPAGKKKVVRKKKTVEATPE